MKKFFTISVVLTFALLVAPSAIVAQDESPQSTEEQSVGITYSEPVESIWEFGVRITASGKASGISATAPVPVNWDEQEIEIVAQEKSDAVARITIKKLTKEAKQMLCKINRLDPGETAEAIVRLKVVKRHIIAPADPSLLKLADKIPSKLRQYLRPSPQIECNHKRIKELAATIATDAELSDWEQVEAIYQWVRDKVEYKFDPQIHTCLEAIDSGFGDCEELSSLFIAICRAKKIPARAVWIPNHTYPEFYMTDGDGNGHWIPCQAAGTYQFGSMTESRPILQKGDRFKLPGNPKVVRYIQPTLIAKDAAGGLKFEWVNQEAEGAESSVESTGRDK